MKYFDYKQKKLINAWHKISLNSDDAYVCYIAEWIAFNAICYNLFYDNAIKERAQIDTKKSKLKNINKRLTSDEEIEVQQAKVTLKDDKWSIDLFLPERIYLNISKNFTEDLIFHEFVANFCVWYQNNSTDLFNDIKNSLYRGERSYVINMAKSDFYNENNNVDEMARSNVIVLCEKNDLTTLKNVLYQIRCNIFHGEKTPGDLNDDRIVKSAFPILKYLVENLMDLYEIDKMEHITKF
jgi:hypothetical protein